jgi:hypothetical protein
LLGKHNGIFADLHSVIPFHLLQGAESRGLQFVTKPHSSIEMKGNGIVSLSSIYWGLKVAFFVGSPIKHLIPLYAIHLVFSYDVDFLNYLASFLPRKGRRNTRRTKPNDE